MNKKKRRKRSKRRFAKSGVNKTGKDNAEKNNLMKEQRKKTPPPHPGDIASVKPSRRKAWCPSCRAHTHSKGSTRGYRSSDSYNPSKDSHTDWTCLHCRGTSFVPSERQYWAFVVVVSGTLVFSCLAYLFELKPSGYGLIAYIAYSFAAVLCTRLMHRFTRYRDWSQWAKEQKANNP